MTGVNQYDTIKSDKEILLIERSKEMTFETFLKVVYEMTYEEFMSDAVDFSTAVEIRTEIQR